MKITHLRVHPHRRGKIIIQLDTGQQLVVSESTIVSTGITSDQELSEDQFHQLQKTAAHEHALDRALQYLAARPRSEREIRQHLRSASVPEAEQEQTLAKLREQGLVDDSAFAQFWRESRDSTSPRGAQLLRHELRLKGLTNDTIASVLPTAEEEHRLAGHLLERSLSRFHGHTWRDFQAQFFPYLQRRGFSSDTISHVLRTTWQELHEKPEHSDY
ncbi:MAG: RecX family transcriptional regulator [Chloroflexi bacterium]|nr:RecX family transcriptional regulator [Chloroflexota bacterium]MCL5947298.1 RecX family transcriptional regulator [Chloroflexota bacterium]